jgi:hypothetical protein
MAFFGPRLDRPSGVGTEGRPRATSMTVASVATVGLFVLTGWVLGSPGFVLSVGSLIGFTVAGGALQTRDRLVHRFVGHLTFFLFGTLLATRLVGITATGGLVVTGFVVAMVALGLTWANVGDGGGVRETTRGVGMTYVALFVWLIAAGTVAVTYEVTFSTLTGSTLLVAPLHALVAFAAVLAATLTSIWLALGTLPILQLAPRDRRDRIRRRLERARWLTARLAGVAGATALVGLLAVGYRGGTLVLGGADPLGSLFLALGSPVVLVALVAIGTVALLASAFARAVRLLTAHVDAGTERLVAAAGAAGLLLALYATATVFLPGLIDTVLLGAVLLLPLLVLFLLGLVLAAVEFGVVPDRAGGPAVAAAGLFGAAVGAGLADLPAPVVFAIVAGGLVVWDVSTYGLGVTAELGHLPETRRLELFHGVIAVGVGVVAVLGLWAVVRGRQTVRFGGGDPVLAVALVVGLLLLSLVLRG